MSSYFGQDLRQGQGNWDQAFRAWQGSDSTGCSLPLSYSESFSHASESTNSAILVPTSH